MILEHKERLAQEFYDYLLQIKETTLFLNDKPSADVRKETLQKWLESLFCGHLSGAPQPHRQGACEDRSARQLCQLVHDPGAAVLHRGHRKKFGDPAERLSMISSLEKILDHNLDVMTSSFREAELKTVAPLFKFEDALVTFTRKYVYGLNVLLVFGLFAIGLMTLGLFTYDLTYLFDGQYEKAILSSIGSLPILRVVIELLDTEIKHLKGGGFTIRVFISVALVAVIRKVLISPRCNTTITPRNGR